MSLSRHISVLAQQQVPLSFGVQRLCGVLLGRHVGIIGYMIKLNPQTPLLPGGQVAESSNSDHMVDISGD